MPRRKLADLELTDEQKAFIDEHVGNMSLLEITRHVFKDQSLDGRSREGRAVRKYIVEQDYDYETSAHKLVGDITFTKDEEEFIEINAAKGMSATEIAQCLFQDAGITPTHKEAKTVYAYMEDNRLFPDDTAPPQKYRPPVTILHALSKVNKYAANEVALRAADLTPDLRRKLDGLRMFMRSHIFCSTMDSMASKSDQELFESQFVSFTWDKPDLTAEEISLNICYCKEFVHVRHIEKLREIALDISGSSSGELTTDQLANNINVIDKLNKHYDEASGRMKKYYETLNKKRSARMEEQKQDKGNIVELVKFFQTEDGRRQMLETVRRHREVIGEEIDHLAAVDELKAKVMGLRREDVV